MLDIKTLLFINFIVNLISLVATIIIWRQYWKRFTGISFWVVHMFFQVIGIGLDILPGFMSEVVTSLLSNVLILSGALCMLIGLERFVGKKGPQVHNFVLLTAFIPVFIYFAARSNLTMRSVTVAFMIIIFESQVGWLTLKRVPSELRKTTQIVGVVTSGYVVVSLIRIILLLAFPIETNDFFNTGPANSIAITTYLSLHICLAIALVLMVTRRLLTEIQAEEEKFTKAFHSSPYAILLSRLSDGKIFEVNGGFTKITGFQKDEAVRKTTLDLNIIGGAERTSVMNQLSMDGKVRDYEVQVRKKSGEIRIGLLSADVIVINDEPCVLSSISDITEQSQMRNRLQDLATHDALTGLPNRRLFYDRFELSLANAQRRKGKMALLSIDLDKFKVINDTLGHEAGDVVLIEAARRLSDCVRKVDTAARFGGDEFVLLLWEVNSCEDAVTVAKRILLVFSQPFVVGEHQLQLSASIGISIYPDHGGDLQTLLRMSDEGLYRTKETGRNGYSLR
jgi:diguanylate cyclase (GGDEF)-like protein/PAS domain S-box-containing protein